MVLGPFFLVDVGIGGRVGAGRVLVVHVLVGTTLLVPVGVMTVTIVFVVWCVCVFVLW